MYSIGIDLGGTNIAVGIVDSDYRILKKSSIPTNAQRPADEITADIAALCKQIVAQLAVAVRQFTHAGFLKIETAVVAVHALRNGVDQIVGERPVRVPERQALQRKVRPGEDHRRAAKLLIKRLGRGKNRERKQDEKEGEDLFHFREDRKMGGKSV